MKTTIFAVLLGSALIFAAGEPLKIQWLGVSARSIALGNVGVGIRGLPCAAFYNPALVSAFGKSSFSGGNQFLALDRRQYSLSYATEIKGGAGIGIAWVHSSVADIEARDTDGEKAGNIENSNDAIFFAFAKSPYENINLGLNVEYIQMSLENVTTYSAGFGAGATYFFQEPQITLGFSAQNLFMTFTWNSNDYYGTGHSINEKMPITMRLGGSYSPSFSGIPVSLCADIWKAEASPIYYGLGLEAELFAKPLDEEENPGMRGTVDESKGIQMPHLLLRAGFTDNRPSGGAGIYSKVSKMLRIGVDYAIVMERENLPVRHIVDLTVEY